MSNMDGFLAISNTPYLPNGHQHGLVPFSERSFHRVMALMGLGATAFVAYCIYRRLTKNSLGSVSLDTVRVEGIESNGSLVNTAEEKPKVILHQIPRGYYAPCIAPFALKLETFLRVANIPYEMSFIAETEDRSTWITIDGKDISDSSECISHICEIFNVDLERGASKSRVTASRLVNVMLENHLYWGILLWRWVFDDGNSVDLVQPTDRSGIKKKKDCADSIYRAAWFHGIGRLGPEQVVELILQDFADLSSALGKHDYFLGNKPGIVDCSAFGMLCQIVWNLPGSPFETEIRKYPNLMKFLFRMKETFWPDWESVLQRKRSDSFFLLDETNSFAWRGYVEPALSEKSDFDVEMTTSTTSLLTDHQSRTSHLSDDDEGEEESYLGIFNPYELFVETTYENQNIMKTNIDNDVLPTQQRVTAKQNVAKIASRMSNNSLITEYQTKKYIIDQLEHVETEQQRQIDIAVNLQNVQHQGHVFLEGPSYDEPPVMSCYEMQEKKIKKAKSAKSQSKTAKVIKKDS